MVSGKYEGLLSRILEPAVTPKENAMLRTADLVFDDVVEGTVAILTDPRWNARMGIADVGFIIYQASQVTGTGPTLTVGVQSSPDNLNWITDGTPPVNAADIGATPLGGSDLLPNGAPYSRLSISLGATSGTPSARLKIWWVGRDFTF